MPALPQPCDLGLDPKLFPSFRDGQLDLATRLAFSPYRYPLLNAACGIGKSAIYYTAALLLDLRLLILTPQKALQDQLLGDFGPPHGDLVDVRGQSNYTCSRFHNCEIGAANECPLRRLPESDPARCPNLRAIDRARAARRVVTNHAFWMTQGKAKQSAVDSAAAPPGIGSFDLIVIDEGHGIPERLADFCAVELIEREVEQLLDAPCMPSTSSLIQWSEWAQAASTRIPQALKSAGSPKERYRVLAIGRDLIELSGIATDRSTQWIYQPSATDGGRHKFSPVWASAHAESLLLQGTDKVIFTSATLLPSIVQYLGLDPADSEYIDVATGFDPSSRPFIYCPSGVQVNYREMQRPGSIRVLTSKYDQIIDLWRGYKGLFHSQSYDLQEKILSATRNRHRFIVCERRGLSASDAIRQLKVSISDKIVIGPALKEGFSLDDDDARFQIIGKMPIVNKQDPVTKARCEAIPQYEWDRLSIDLQQETGRIVRSSRDWGWTYTADDAWVWVRRKVFRPESFMSAERWESDRVPGPPRY